MWLALDVTRRNLENFAFIYLQGVFNAHKRQKCVRSVALYGSEMAGVRHVRSVVLYGSETWAMNEEDLAKREINDLIMVRWMCNDRKSSDELRDRMRFVSIRNFTKRQAKVVLTY